MVSVPALAEHHHVRVGHTQFVAPPGPSLSLRAACLDALHPWCEWTSYTGHARGDAVRHAVVAGHVVAVAEGRTVTMIEVTS